MDSNKKMGKFDIDIEIKDLLWEFIRRWRIIVVLAIACGFALTVYQYRADTNKTDVVTVKKSQEELEEAMGEQDLDEVTAAVALKRQLDERSAYMEASKLMQINPYEENAVILHYYVSADAKNVAVDAKNAYTSYVENDTLAQVLADVGKYEIEPVYLAELIDIVKNESSVYVNAKDAKESFNLSVQEGVQERIFSIKVIGDTIENAEMLANDVIIAMERYNSTLSDVIGVHRLQLIEESSGVIIDQNLAERQNWNATAIKTISNNLDSMKNEMTSDQISLYVYRTTVLAENGSADSATNSNDKDVNISIKHLIIGVIIGIILACAIIFILYLFAPALRSSDEVKTLYGIKILGCVDDTAFQSKKLFGSIDKFIVKLQNGKKQPLTFEQEVQMICTNIVLGCKKNKKNEVFLTSSLVETIPVNVQSAIVNQCEEKGIHVTVGSAIHYDAEALELSARIGNVVFIEKERVSLYDELYNEIALCKEHNICVLGMVLLGK